MLVDFYHLTRDPAEKLIPVLAAKCLDAGEKILLVSDNEEQCAALSKTLWASDPTSFLAHGFAGSDQEVSQPILISDRCEAENSAQYVLLGDGEWREEALAFKRVFYLFTGQQIDQARAVWRDLSAKDGVAPRYWKQDGGRWEEGP